MENIVERLQKEAGLTEEQALKSLSIVKDFMDKEGLEVDWEKFFKGKYSSFKESISSFFSKISDKASDFGDKVGDKVEDMTTDAKRKMRDISKGKEE
ncbi:hypothetical protein O2K51_09550 [Apibacter raozihei]|uniref:hypothetical protein n=1 Tax=Apibacter TaxID=1778601 RepID=UPI000FE40EF1|nr:MULTISPECIES: hypothetical protein [Apibacter]